MNTKELARRYSVVFYGRPARKNMGGRNSHGIMRRDSDQIGSRICDMEELRILYENEIAIGI